MCSAEAGRLVTSRRPQAARAMQPAGHIEAKPEQDAELVAGVENHDEEALR